VDALSDMLMALRVSGSLFIDAHLTAPWAVITPSSRDIASALGAETSRIIPYHLITEGECIVTLEGNEPRRIKAGDVALFPHGHVHMLASHDEVAALTLSRKFVDGVLLRRKVLPVRHGGEGESTKLLCGFLAIERWGDHLIAGLPDLLTAQVGTRGGHELLAAAARRSIEAQVAGGQGSEALVGKLSEMLFVDALRQFVSDQTAPACGWLAGLRDPTIGRALSLIHGRPQHLWDIKTLASACATSRSKFIARFTALVGSPPMKYLLRWRMSLAARDLSDEKLAVIQVANRYAYGSEASFTRAFRKVFDVPPAAFRRARINGRSDRIAATSAP
jgi:AraC-like DNA-binding protein